MTTRWSRAMPANQWPPELGHWFAGIARDQRVVIHEALWIGGHGAALAASLCWKRDFSPPHTIGVYGHQARDRPDRPLLSWSAGYNRCIPYRRADFGFIPFA